MPLAGEKFAAVGATPELVERVPLTLVRKDGTTFAAEVTTTGVFEDGRWVGAQGTVRDVSERVRLERELRESEERYRYLVQNAPDLVWSIDADSKMTFLSDACERLTGFKPEELLGKHFGAIVHESSRDVAEIDWTLAMAAPAQELRGRISLLHRDGSAVPAEFIAVASVDANGKFIGRQRLGPRHARARSPGARAAAVRGALPLPRRQLAGHRLRHRPGREVQLRLRVGPSRARPRADRMLGGDLRLGHPLRPPGGRGHAVRDDAARTPTWSW